MWPRAGCGAVSRLLFFYLHVYCILHGRSTLYSKSLPIDPCPIMSHQASELPTGNQNIYGGVRGNSEESGVQDGGGSPGEGPNVETEPFTVNKLGNTKKILASLKWTLLRA
ncbi:hypothetical protein MVEN_01165600 [Mycena venus]|uniref:Uncharacterized protein n=1 Tax=Mycena venus TaxID=2733690 RepID=A0A8H7CYG0_9AGAR|nr:hypothetical protein MVEN_01165600 [Mycena venus]